MKISKIEIFFLCISLFIIQLISACSNFKTPPPIHFTIIKCDLDKFVEKQRFDDFVRNNHLSTNFQPIKGTIKGHYTNFGRCIYKDSAWEVYGGGMGEFGGRIIFINPKDTTKCYYYECLDPQLVAKQNGKYYITDVFHAYNLSRIMEITAPEKGFCVPIDSFKNGRWKAFYQKKLGFKDYHVLSDSLFREDLNYIELRRPFAAGDNYRIHVFYPYQNRKFMLYGDDKGFYFGENNSDTSFIHIDTIFNYSIRQKNWYTKTNYIENNIYVYHYFDKNSTVGDCQTTGVGECGEALSSGTVFIKKDTILIGYKEYPYLKKHKQTL